jgi:hypothetical protein
MLVLRIRGIAFALALAGGAIGLGHSYASPQTPLAADAFLQDGSHLQPPSEAEMKARSLKVIANQHQDDTALDQYEHTERVYDRTAGQNPRVVEDKTYRVVPTGSGTYKILMKDGERPVDESEYRRQLQQWVEALELALKPDDPRMKAASEKYQKRMHDRADLVDATNDAYIQKWVGSETMNGHVCDVVALEPNPKFHPHSVFQEALTHATVKVWVDHDSDQIVRGEAHITRDISIGGGVFGKLYRGGVFYLEQEEVAPGVWLPVRRQYDFSGRKFLFPFEEHQLIEDSHYRHLGSPNQMLSTAKSEIANGKPAAGNP